MRSILTAILLLVVGLSPQSGFADDRLLNNALSAAQASFAQALPQLGAAEWGVDVAAYRDALMQQRFNSALWSGTYDVGLVIGEQRTGTCARYAAYAITPPEDGSVLIVLCPQFFTPGADALRELTILHEMVHAVAGRDECQAMAFAALVEQRATGSYTPVDPYWRANNCAASRYSLP